MHVLQSFETQHNYNTQQFFYTCTLIHTIIHFLSYSFYLSVSRSFSFLSPLSSSSSLSFLSPTQAKAQVNTQHGSTNITPLMCACLNRHTEVVKLLLKYRADPSLSDSQGYTALHYTIWSRESDMKGVKMLLSQCGRLVLSQRDSWGRTPLLIAAAKVIIS